MEMLVTLELEFGVVIAPETFRQVHDVWRHQRTRIGCLRADSHRYAADRGSDRRPSSIQ